MILTHFVRRIEGLARKYRRACSIGVTHFHLMSLRNPRPIGPTIIPRQRLTITMRIFPHPGLSLLTVIVYGLLSPMGMAQQAETEQTVTAVAANETSTPEEEAKPLPVAQQASSVTAPISVLPPEGAINLLSTQNYQSEWVYYSAEQNSPQSGTWTLNSTDAKVSPILICKGKPFGYLKTRRRFRDYDFGFEWRYPSGESSNSGVLLFTNGEDKIWPAAIQVQLHLSGAGSVIPIGGAKLKRGLEVREKLANHGTWHHCQIHAQDGAVTVTINGKILGTVPECATEDGHVALQSQGAEIQFRNVWIRQRRRK